MVTAVIVAGGKSQRMGSDIDKAFLSLGPQPVLAYSLCVFQDCPEVHSIVLVVRKEQLTAAQGVCQMFGISKLKAIVTGGASRQDSVMAGLKAVDPDTTIVCVHDAARPCVTKELVAETVASAKKCGSGVAATKITDTVKAASAAQTVTETLDREKLWTVQTPQTFKLPLLARAFAELGKAKGRVTDEASAVERLGETVHLVPTAFLNLKITTPDDLPLASLLLGIH
ncbi:MAG: 2-C-methyl-D-erythritol 4-phosphate cytidylyltransferase [Kiritimatiellaeota bacterium]|nr:2-C-methyl-D-erythritol 4-phosphate cytidylyltransferase [Kiritimatiellota bacterium]